MTDSYRVASPESQTLPIVLASPHSGRYYAPEFLEKAHLAKHALRMSEDAYVDTLFAAAPDLGAPMIKALFPRTFVDANREPLELDSDMFAERLPWPINRTSPRVRGGLGVIARVGANGAPIYDRPLPVAEARDRLRNHYFPYHRALRQLLTETRRRFGYAILLDCHSMPSQAVARLSAAVRSRPGHPARPIDFVLGDCHGASCMGALTDRAEAVLTALGYSVTRNSPYAGGFTTRRYGHPENGVHALQIEVNRALYMDEKTLEPHGDGAALREDLNSLVRQIATATPLARAAE
jgi:N-formylglutamate amidohydrolase